MGSTEPPLFAGEPEHCSLCGEPGHTHDDHWLFQHEPVIALQSECKQLKALIADAVHVFGEVKADYEVTKAHFTSTVSARTWEQIDAWLERAKKSK